jgi:hypothetical protein
MKREDIKDFLKEVLTGLEEQDDLVEIRSHVMKATTEFITTLAKELEPYDNNKRDIIISALNKFDKEVEKAFNL